LNSRHFPLTKSYDWISREKKNLFIVDFTARKRSDWDKPILRIYGAYYRQEGNYAFSVTVDKGILSIYAPHFFSRYKERILKDTFLSKEEVIRHYFRNDWGFMGTVVNRKFENVLFSFEDKSENNEIDFVAATSLGYCFGIKQGKVNIIKTIISHEMLFYDQKEVFADLRRAFNEANRERYS